MIAHCIYETTGLAIMSINFHLLFSDHAKELGNSVPDTPLLFLKPSTAYIHEGQKIKVHMMR